MRALVVILALACVVLAVILCRREEPTWTDASADTGSYATSSSTHLTSSTQHTKDAASERGIENAVLPDGTAHAKPTAPPPSPMRKALLRLFIPHEADQLEALYIENAAKMPPDTPPELLSRLPVEQRLDVAAVRAQVKEIVGDAGFKALMAEASPPDNIKPNTDDMVQYVFSRPPLIWWSVLKE